MSRHVVIGGGICGLIAAWSFRRRHPDAHITLLERAPRLGGLLASHHYPDAGLSFDQGTHILQETGDADIDAFLRDSIPPEHLHYPPGGASDLAGAVFRDRLQLHSPYPDLRKHPDRMRLLTALQNHLTGTSFTPELRREASLVETCRRRFGYECADQIIVPLIASLYQIQPEELSTLALLLPGLGRLIFSDETEWTRHADSAAWRATVAFPDQFRLPTTYRHSRRFFTHRKNGAGAVIDAIGAHLSTEGAAILTGTELLEFDPTKMTITHGGDGRSIETIVADSVFFSTGIVGAAVLLGLRPADFNMEPPMPHRVVHLLLDSPVECPLHYFYGLDRADPFYRVTHYRAFSGDSSDRRLTIEVLGRAEIDDEALPARIMARLRDIGFLSGESILFSQVERLSRGFPRPTLRNSRALAELRREVAKRMPAAALIGGAGAADGLFFTNETLLHAHALIRDGRSGELSP